MRAQTPFRALSERSPTQQSVLMLAATLALAGGVWLWAVLAAPAAAAGLVGWCGALAVLALCVAVAVAAYQGGAARRLRDRVAKLSGDSTRLEMEISRLAEHALPTLAKRLREGASAEAALADAPRPAGSQANRLLQAVAREIAASERRAAAALAARASIESEASRLADEVLPSVVSRIRESATAEVALHESAQPANAVLAAVLSTAAHEIAKGERKGSAAMSATASAAARIQAQTTKMLADLRELEHQHSEDAIFADLLDLDHAISQLGRLADSVALLSGGRSGRRWPKPIVVESILRGAMGRVDAYRRVVTHSATSAAVAGYAAEGVMHTLAELLDNAAAFSAQDTQVHVYVEEEDAGLVLTIEDSGLGMRTRERRKAEEMVADPPDLTTLPGTRLGLAVVGRLARKHGLTVSFRPSSRGGTGVVVMIPRQLLTQLRPGEDAPRLAEPGQSGPTPAVPADPGAGRPAADRDGAAGDGAGAQAGADADEELLPRRRRGQTLAAAAARQADRAGPTPDLPPRRPAQTGARFAAFRNAGRPAAPQEPPVEQSSSPEQDSR